jgi:hypothetical protein
MWAFVSLCDSPSISDCYLSGDPWRENYHNPGRLPNSRHVHHCQAFIFALLQRVITVLSESR